MCVRACVRVCVCMCGFCNVCVCEGFVMCGCFGNMYTVLWLRFFLIWLRFILPWLRFFRAFSSDCKANARVKLAKTGHGRHYSTLVVICVVRLLSVFFYVLFVCKCVLPPGDKPIAVNKYIISFSNLSILHTYPPIKMEQSVPKSRYIKFRLRGITQKKAYSFNDNVIR
jgi:hypothetical protein